MLEKDIPNIEFSGEDRWRMLQHHKLYSLQLDDYDLTFSAQEDGTVILTQTDAENDDIEHEIILPEFTTFLTQLLIAYQRAQGYFDNTTW